MPASPRGGRAAGMLLQRDGADHLKLKRIVPRVLPVDVFERPTIGELAELVEDLGAMA